MHQRRRSSRARAGVVLLALVGSLLGSMAVAGPASAHGDEGEMTVITAEPAGPMKVRFQVGILYANDQEPATDATVTVSGTGPDGTTLAPTPLPVEEGAKYGATVDIPANGAWTFTFTSEAPEATATADVEVEVNQNTSTTEAETTTTEAATTTAAPETTTTDGSEVSPEAGDDESDDSDSNAGTIAVIAIAALAVIVGSALYVRSRSSKDASPSDGPPDAPAAGL